MNAPSKADILAGSIFVPQYPTVQTQPAHFLTLTQYPNPFSTQTTLEYELPTPQRVRLDVLSSLGQTLLTLVDEWQQAGRHSIPADMSSFANGVYMLRLQAGGQSEVRMLNVVR